VSVYETDYDSLKFILKELKKMPIPERIEDESEEEDDNELGEAAVWSSSAAAADNPGISSSCMYAPSTRPYDHHWQFCTVLLFSCPQTRETQLQKRKRKRRCWCTPPPRRQTRRKC
jgi:hypothetical protein